MPLINLIQEQRLIVKQREQRTRLLTLMAIGACAFLGAGYFTCQAAMLEAKARGLSSQIAKLEPTVKQVDTNQKEIGKLTPRLTTLVSAQKGTERWLKILDHLSRNTPDGVWLTTLRCTQADKTKPVVAQFNGTSGSQDTIGAFLLRLQSCSELDKVTLKFTQERVSSTGRGIEFEIVSDIVGTAEKKAVEEKDKDKKEAS